MAASWNAHAGQDCVIRLSAFGTSGGAEFRNVGGSFYDFELARFSGRAREVAVRESRDWLGKAILDWAGRLGPGERLRSRDRAQRAGERGGGGGLRKPGKDLKDTKDTKDTKD